MRKLLTDLDMNGNTIENVGNIYKKTEIDEIVEDLETKISEAGGEGNTTGVKVVDETLVCSNVTVEEEILII